MIELGDRPAVVFQAAPFQIEAISLNLALAQELRKWDIAIVWLAHGTALELVRQGHDVDYVLPFDLSESEHRTQYAHYIEDADAVVVNSDPDFAKFAIRLDKKPIYIDNSTRTADEMPEFGPRCDLYIQYIHQKGLDLIIQAVFNRLEARTGQALRPSQRGNFQSIPLPRKLTLELFGGCQLRCPLCPTGNRLKPSRGKGPLKIRTVEALLEELGDHVETIELFNWGEPFLNPDTCKIIRMIADRGIRTVLSSNLQRIPEPREIIDSGLSELLVSCHGITQQTYEKYMIGGDVTRTLDNIDRIVAEGGRDMKMKIILRFVVFAHNEHELPLAEQRFSGTPVIIEAAPMRMDMRDEILSTQEQNLRKYGEWVPESSRFYDKQRKEATRSPLGCNLPFEESVVDVDGSVSMCCSSFDPKYNVGNFLVDGFSAVWNGKNYQEARRVVTGRGETGTENVICRTCKNNSYRDF
jgi:radical SAM protein with 4Fe4S-binding SPASM domain